MQRDGAVWWPGVQARWQGGGVGAQAVLLASVRAVDA